MRSKVQKLVSKAALRVVRIEDVKTDPTYQREVKPKHRKIAEQFNEEAFGIPLVGERSDGTLWIVDGLQRLTAAKLLGHKTVRAEVFASRGPEHEAEVFKIVNLNRTKLTPMEMFKSLLTAHDETAWAIKNAVENEGFRIPTHGTKSSGKWGNKEIICISTLMMFGSGRGKYVRKHGIPGISFALRTIREVWPDDRLSSYNAMIGGLVQFYVSADGVVDEERLRERLRTTTPQKILYTASQLVVSGSRIDSVKDVIVRLYQKRRSSSSAKERKDRN